MEWFKFYGKDWLTDLKVIKMSIEDRLCFITLLCLASASGDGTIKKCDEQSVIELTHLYNDPCETNNEYTRAVGFLKRLNDNGMITIDETGNVTIINFLKRQQRALSNYERVKRYRERQKTAQPLDEMNDNGMITDDNDNDNAREEKIREDKRRINIDRTKKFTPPTLAEITAYCTERGNKVRPQRFLDHYESNGWKVGKNPMKDWKAAVRTWEQNDLNGKEKQQSPQGKYDKLKTIEVTT